MMSARAHVLTTRASNETVSAMCALERESVCRVGGGWGRVCRVGGGCVKGCIFVLLSFPSISRGRVGERDFQLCTSRH